jgi:hypothetical protein
MTDRLAITALLLASSLCAIAKDDEQTLQSRFASETQFRSLTVENEKLTAELGELTAFQAVIEQARKCIAEKAVDGKTAGAALDGLRKFIADLRKMPPGTQIGARTAIGQRMNNAMNQFYSVMPGQLNECRQRVLPQFRGPGQPSAEPLLDPIKEAGFPQRSGKLDDVFERSFAGLFRLSARVSYEDVRRRSDLSADELAAVEKELAAGPEAVGKLFSDFKDQDLKGLDRMSGALRAALEAKNAKVKENREKLAGLDKNLNDKQAAQAAIDRGLLFAVYGMIAALTLMFLGLTIFPVALATQVVRDRSLVEVVSMAFILLTIIILGTGDRIGKETIGTLLGTIGGYIFARKLAEDAGKGTRPGRDASSGSAPDADKAKSEEKAAETGRAP